MTSAVETEQYMFGRRFITGMRYTLMFEKSECVTLLYNVQSVENDYKVRTNTFV